MTKRVWKTLKPPDVAVLTDYLDQMPEEQRPLYGFVGIKTSLWSQMGGGTKPFVVVFMPDRVVFSKRSLGGTKQAWASEHALGDLTDVSVRQGPAFDSALFTFTDGYKVRVGNIGHSGGDQEIRPVTEYMRTGPAAFDWSRLSDYQRTACYYAFSLLELIPRDLLESHRV